LRYLTPIPFERLHHWANNIKSLVSGKSERCLATLVEKCILVLRSENCFSSHMKRINKKTHIYFAKAHIGFWLIHSCARPTSRTMNATSTVIPFHHD